MRSKALLTAVVAALCLWTVGGGAGASSASAQIKNLNIGIGIDADTLNPQEQTTTLIQNICDLIFDTLLFVTPEGKLEPRLAT